MHAKHEKNTVQYKKVFKKMFKIKIKLIPFSKEKLHRFVPLTVDLPGEHKS